MPLLRSNRLGLVSLPFAPRFSRWENLGKGIYPSHNAACIIRVSDFCWGLHSSPGIGGYMAFTRLRFVTRRDLIVASLAVLCTSGAFVLAGQTPVLGPSAFEWNAVTVRQTAFGSMRSFIHSRTATLDQLDVHVTTIDPGKSTHPPVRQPSEELIIVKQGTIDAMVGSEWKRVGPGSVVFNASSQLHGIRNAGTDAAVYYVVNWRTPATPPEPHP